MHHFDQSVMVGVQPSVLCKVLLAAYDAAEAAGKEPEGAGRMVFLGWGWRCWLAGAETETEVEKLFIVTRLLDTCEDWPGMQGCRLCLKRDRDRENCENPTSLSWLHCLSQWGLKG